MPSEAGKENLRQPGINSALETRESKGVCCKEELPTISRRAGLTLGSQRSLSYFLKKERVLSTKLVMKIQKRMLQGERKAYANPLYVQRQSNGLRCQEHRGLVG